MGAAHIDMTAISGLFERIVRRNHEEMQERMGRLEDIHQRATRVDAQQGAAQGARRVQVEPEVEREQPPPRRQAHEDEWPETVRAIIPLFKGKSDPDAYLDWELKVEHCFTCHHYSEAQKVRVATLEFTDYTLHWLDRQVKERRHYGEPPGDTWEERIRLLRRRHVPSHYNRDLQLRVQRMSQGSKSVDEYHRDMEMAMIRANIREDIETTMSWFLEGLKPEIRDIVEMSTYLDMDELVDQATKAEQQLKRRVIARRNQLENSSGDWKVKGKADAAQTWRRDTPPRGRGPRDGNPPSGGRSRSPQAGRQNKRGRNIKCYKCLGHGHIASECPTKKVMMLNDNGELTSEEERENSASEGETEEEADKFVTPHDADSDLLMLKRILSAQPQENDTSQRGNMFHTRGEVEGKTCCIIMDRGELH